MQKKEDPHVTSTGGVSMEALETLRQVSTGMVIDALAMAGIQGGVPGVRPARGAEDARIVGPATTVRFGQPDPGAPKMTVYRAISDSEPGTVLVLDGQGLERHFTGDNQGEWAKRHGLLGVVVYGGARDIAGYREMGMPLYCIGSATADKPKELQVAGHNVPVDLGGIPVKPGDIIVADEDGVVVVPAEALDTVMENLKTMFEVEEDMSRAIKSDAPVEEIEAIIARKKPKK
jgi:4-hydroxy-4-methyl-2-oxoglutarate aldolase